MSQPAEALEIYEQVKDDVVKKTNKATVATHRGCLATIAGNRACAPLVYGLIAGSTERTLWLLAAIANKFPKMVQSLIGGALIEASKSGPSELAVFASEEKLPPLEEELGPEGAAAGPMPDDPREKKKWFNAQWKKMRTALVLNIKRKGLPLEGPNAIDTKDPEGTYQVDDDDEFEMINGIKHLHLNPCEVLSECEFTFKKITEKNKALGKTGTTRKLREAKREEVMDYDGDGDIDENDLELHHDEDYRQKVPKAFYDTKDHGLAIFQMKIEILMEFNDEAFEFEILGNRCWLPHHVATIRLGGMMADGGKGFVKLKANTVVWWDIAGERIAFGFTDVTVEWDVELQVLCCQMPDSVEDERLPNMVRDIIMGYNVDNPFIIDMAADRAKAAEMLKKFEGKQRASKADDARLRSKGMTRDECGDVVKREESCDTSGASPEEDAHTTGYKSEKVIC